MTTETRILNFHPTRSESPNQTGKSRMKSATGRNPSARKQFPYSIELPPDELPSFQKYQSEPTSIFSAVRPESGISNRQTDPSLITTTINNVAVAYRTMGLYDEAKQLLEFGVQSFRRYNFSSQLELAAIMDNLAAVYSDLEKFELAEKVGKRSLLIRQMELGPEGHDVAVSLDNLGLICAQQEKYREAKSLYRKALSIFKKTSQRPNLDMATCLNNLATLYFNLGNYAEAKRHYIRAIAVAQSTTTDKIPELGIYYNNLGELYRSEGDISNALHLFQMGYENLQSSYGPNHPETCLVMENFKALSQQKRVFCKSHYEIKDFRGEKNK